MKNLFLNGAIYLYGNVVVDSFYGAEEFSPSDVVRALADHGPGDVTVRLNSGGGVAFAGMAIHSLFKSHPGKVTMIVDGVAASSASLIFMAASERHMRLGTMLMIHDPASISIGTAKDHAESSKNMKQLSENYADVYAAASGLPVEKVRAMMTATTWMTAEFATENGFATRVLDDRAVAAAAFDYAIYGNAPLGLADRKPEAKHDAGSAAAARMRMRQAELS